MDCSGSSIRMNNIFPCIKTIYCTFQRCITLCCIPCLSILFCNVDLCIYTFVCYIFGRCLSDSKSHIIRLCIDLIPCWNRDFFQINNFLCFLHCELWSTILISCRHLCNQLCTCSIGIDPVHCTSQCISCILVFLYNGYLTFFCPGYFKIHIFLISDTFTENKSQILCSGSCYNLVSRVFFINASLHPRRKCSTDDLCLIKWCCQIKLCTSTDFYTCSCSTGFTGCHIYKLYTAWQLKCDCLQFICFECDHACSLAVSFHISLYIRFGKAHIYRRNVRHIYTIIVKLHCQVLSCCISSGCPVTGSICISRCKMRNDESLSCRKIRMFLIEETILITCFCSVIADLCKCLSIGKFLDRISSISRSFFRWFNTVCCRIDASPFHIIRTSQIRT